jgi:heat shock protein HtpX
MPLLPVTGLQTHVWANTLRAVVLLATYPVILCGAAWGVYWVCAGLDVERATRLVVGHAPWIVLGVLAWFAVAWFGHTRMIRAMARSRPVTRRQEPELYNALENLCISRGVPMPRLEVIESRSLNAFASGVHADSYTITVTRGLMHDLTRAELEAVLAHELTHILCRDARTLVVALIFTGLLSFAAQMAWRAASFGQPIGWDDRGHSIIAPLSLAFMLVAAILGAFYLLAAATRFAISRRREFVADAGAVDLTHDPAALMLALRKIASSSRIPGASPDIAILCTHSTGRLLGIFATHPPIAARLSALSALTATPVPDLPPAWLHKLQTRRAFQNRTWPFGPRRT